MADDLISRILARRAGTAPYHLGIEELCDRILAEAEKIEAMELALEATKQAHADLSALHADLRAHAGLMAVLLERFAAGSRSEQDRKDASTALYAYRANTTLTALPSAGQRWDAAPLICTADGYPFEMMGRDGE
ncbi:hypothetical protein [Mangrovicoccus sp. HB161399]|uniref:hypothetical protein n=1 Tax=Mangrovicoccus sp. HB161399 TaxID=2720392 RepID=UPI0015566AF8|nr:hypothetical protein [Mangrovicoccus sp. HB161399]